MFRSVMAIATILLLAGCASGGHGTQVSPGKSRIAFSCPYKSVVVCEDLVGNEMTERDCTCAQLISRR